MASTTEGIRRSLAFTPAARPVPWIARSGRPSRVLHAAAAAAAAAGAGRAAGRATAPVVAAAAAAASTRSLLLRLKNRTTMARGSLGQNNDTTITKTLRTGAANKNGGGGNGGANDDDNDRNPQPASLPLPASLAIGGGIVLLAAGTLAGLTHHCVFNCNPADGAAPLAASAGADPTDLVAAVKRLLAAADPNSPQAALAFIGAYASVAVLMLPAALLTLFAGAAFGPVKGSALVFVGATTGACLAFLVARYVARPLVQPRLPERFAAVDAAVAAQGARVVLLLRLSPLIPFGILNYSLGLTRVGFVPYALASVGMIPAIVAYTFIGSTAATAAAGAGAAAVGGAAAGPPEAQMIKFALYSVGAAATLLATKLISDAAGKALAEAEREATEGGGGGGGGGRE